MAMQSQGAAFKTYFALSSLDIISTDLPPHPRFRRAVERQMHGRLKSPSAITRRVSRVKS